MQANYGVPSGPVVSGAPPVMGAPPVTAPGAPPMPQGGGSPYGLPAMPPMMSMALAHSAPPSLAMPSMPYSPPKPLGPNGFGLRHDVTNEEIANYLMPKFKDVESSGDYKNYIGKAHKEPFSDVHTASGAYGYTNPTWNNFEGYARAMDAPPQVQDKRMSQDLLRSLQRFGGDPFKAVAHHYLPARAGNPETWSEPLVDKYGKEIPNSSVEDYIKRVLPSDRVEQYLSAVRNVGGSGGSHGPSI